MVNPTGKEITAYKVEGSLNEQPIGMSLNKYALDDVKKFRNKGMTQFRKGVAKVGFGLAVGALFIAKVVSIAAGLSILGLTAMTPVGWALAAVGFAIGLYMLYKGVKQAKQGHEEARYTLSSKALEQQGVNIQRRGFDLFSKKEIIDKRIITVNKALKTSGASFLFTPEKGYQFSIPPGSASKGEFKVEDLKDETKQLLDEAQKYNDDVIQLAKDKAQYEHDKAHLDALNKGQKGHLNIMFQGTCFLTLGAAFGAALSSGAILGLAQVPGGHGAITSKGALSTPIETIKGLGKEFLTPLEYIKELIYQIPKMI
jgi:hypothetical protein